MARKCPALPKSKTQEIIERTEETGKEHGYVRCGDGSTSEIVSGGKTNMNIGPAVESCNLADGPVEIVHTHPNGVAKLSKADRQVAADPDVKSVCAAVKGGKVHCESVESCEVNL